MWFVRFWILLALFLSAAWLFAQESPPLRPGRLSPEQTAALAPGWTITFLDAADKPLDARAMRLPALFVPAGEAASPLLTPGPFRAVLTGYLKTGLKGTYRFHVTGLGSARLVVNGVEVYSRPDERLAEPVAAKVDLAKGYNKLELHYASPTEGPAQVRLWWTGDEFLTEPPPPDALFHDSRPAPLAAGTSLRTGRQLYATRHCGKCHVSTADWMNAEGRMPELAQDAPSLADVGARLNSDWLVRWILDPRSLSPTATMPRVLAHLTADDAQQTALDIAAYLATLRPANSPAPPPDMGEPPDAELVEQGSRHYEDLGCVACHRLTPPDQADEFARATLYYAGTKFRAGQLAAFLLTPHKHYAWSRMPDFKLKAEEAAALAGFILHEAKGTIEAPAVPGDAARGKIQFATHGCANCHDLPGERDVKKLAQASVFSHAMPTAKGCLADEPAARGKAPDFALPPHDRAGLAALLATNGASLGVDPPAEFAARQVALLNCVACHKRDGGGGRLIPITEAEGLQGLIPENFPPLTWAGEKLRPDWTVKLFRGEVPKSRHWLRARMPGFPARAEGLSVGLSHEHGLAVDEDPRPAVDPQLAEAGRRLVQTQGGFDCVKCHAIGDQKAVAPFEAPGINLAFAAGRLRHDYFARWMSDPPRLDPSMKMPKFAQDGRTTGIRDLYDGDAQRQWEALWHYLETVKQ